jgi:hypothetical protein
VEVGSAHNELEGCGMCRSSSCRSCVEGSRNQAAYQAAMDLLVAPLESSAAIGGMEVRMMALAAMEKVGMDATDASTKAKVMGLLQAYAARGSFEPEARKRAQEAASRIQNSQK